MTDLSSHPMKYAEWNTFFLIAKRRFPAWKALVMLDNVTWVLTRLLLFPLVTLNTIAVWLHLSHSHEVVDTNPSAPKYWNSGLLMALFASTLTVQNVLWSRDKLLLLRLSRHNDQGKDKGKGKGKGKDTGEIVDKKGL